LQVDDAAGESALGLAEVGSADVGLDIGEVEFVEDIEEVGSEFDPRVFSQYPVVRQAEGFSQRHVDVEETRSAEGVASNAWRGGNSAVACKGRHGEVSQASAGEIPVRLAEGVIAVVISRAT